MIARAIPYILLAAGLSVIAASAAVLVRVAIVGYG